MSYQFKHYGKGAIQGSGTYGFRKYSKQVTPQEEYFLTFSSPNSFTLATANSAKNWDGTLEYSTDKNTWNTWSGTSGISSSIDGKLYIRGIGNTIITGPGSDIQWLFSSGSNINISGNIENLLDYATVQNGQHPAMAAYCFRRWMYQNTAITDCSNLVLGAETLTIFCYATMFSGCLNLTKAPSIYAIVMASNCCNSMFYSCTSLTIAPALPATTLENSCYQSMFYSCTGLTSIPALPATTLLYNCYAYMFYGCTNIKISSTQTGEYVNKYRIPYSGTGTMGSGSLTNMFVLTGGTFTTTPTTNTTYYTSNEVV